jgi:hypothetical protein
VDARSTVESSKRKRFVMQVSGTRSLPEGAW